MSLKPQTKRAVLGRHGAKCYLCGEALTHLNCTVDHVVPIARGGNDRAKNLRPACLDCNRAKGSMLLEEYRASRGGVELFWFEQKKQKKVKK